MRSAQERAWLSKGQLSLTGRLLLTCQQGPSWPGEACQGPIANWMAFKAELIKYDFAGPAER